MNQFQPVRFSSVSALLDYLPPNELKIVERLQSLVLACIPDAKEKLSYNVPYYFRHTRICFIWPGSVPWGNVPAGGVALGFCKGHLLADPSYLEAGHRKEVFTKTFYSTRDIDATTLRQLLYEAAAIDAAGKHPKQ